MEELKLRLLESLPPIFTRQVAAKAMGGMLSAGSLANLDCEGRGPGGRVMIGRKVGYQREPFVAWLLKRMSEMPSSATARCGGNGPRQ